MLFLLLFAFLSMTTYVNAFNIPGYKLISLASEARYAPSIGKVSTKTLPLTRTVGVTSAAKFKALRQATNSLAKRGDVPLTPERYSIDYVAPIQWGDQIFFVTVDTGSSDTWLVADDFRCIDLRTIQWAPQTTCGFGPTYHNSSTLRRIPNQQFTIRYADTTFATGYMATEDVTLAGIKAVAQEVAVANVSAWTGQNTSSGILGLAFRPITSAFQVEADGTSNNVNYNPIFTTMVASGEIAPIFAITIQRNDTGVMTIGGIPPVLLDSPLASTPMLALDRLEQETAAPLQAYIISISVRLKSVPRNTTRTATKSRPLERRVNQTEFYTFVDSGTTLNFMERDIAEDIALAFEPPGELSGLGQWRVDCDADPPELRIVIGGKQFLIDKRDMIFFGGDGNCYSSVFDSFGTPGILGDAFLRSVVAIFDVGAGMMSFAAHNY